MALHPFLKKTLTLSFKLTIAISLLWFILRDIPFTHILEAFASIHIGIYIIGLLIGATGKITEAIQMRIIFSALEQKVSTPRILSVSLISMFYDLFLPGYIAGGAIRWYKFSQHGSASAESLVAIIINRCIRTGAIIIAGLFFWLLHHNMNSYQRAGIVLIALSIACALGLTVLFSSWFWKTITRLSHALNKRWIPQRIQEKVTKLITAFNRIQTFRTRTIITILLYAMAGRLVSIASFYIFIRALGLTIGFIHSGWVRELTTIVGMIPVSIMGLGVREGAMLFLLESHGVPAPLCVGLSFLVLAQILLFAFAGGICEGVDHIRSLKKADSSRQ